MTYKIIQGDNRDTLKTIPDNSIDAIVTDPPYGIDFLGKAWDANTGALETYQECLRVLKPGGHILAFSAARTYHHLAVTLEQAGFEIRDQIMWIYSSGFPKSQDIGKSIERTNKKKNENNDSSQWEGWGTNLKPAHEPIALARKPMKTSIAQNCQKYGTGALNIDATRVDSDDWEPRFPSNVLGEIPDYQKYFYCPKVSRKERHTGFEDPGPRHPGADGGGYQVHNVNAELITNVDKKKKHDPLAHIPTNPNGMWDNGVQFQNQQAFSGATEKGNNHPTVKPVALMEYLIKLITPLGGTVLDPFNGSGSTGMAATGLGYNYIGCELDPGYAAITEKRIAAWLAKDEPKPSETFKNLFEEQL
jgi:DNA modification methylase